MPRNVRILKLPRQSGAVRISSSLVRCLDKLRQGISEEKETYQNWEAVKVILRRALNSIKKQLFIRDTYTVFILCLYR